MISCVLQVAFATDFSQTWDDDKLLGLKRAKGTGKLTFLIANSLRGLERTLRSAIPSLYPVRDLHYLHFGACMGGDKSFGLITRLHTKSYQCRLSLQATPLYSKIRKVGIDLQN